MYAVTGAFFGLLTLILLPTVWMVYDGDTQEVFNKITPENRMELDPNAPKTDLNMSFNTLLHQVQRAYPGFQVNRAVLKNYGRVNALVSWRLDDKMGILSSGSAVMYMSDGKILEDYSVEPINKGYSQSVIDLITKLHFGDFGGVWLKVAYFILSLLTCFMIITGVLIWRTARDNDMYTLNQRRFQHRVTKIYLAICISMFPAFAIIFIANKLVPMETDNRAEMVNQIFFMSWLTLTFMGNFWNNYSELIRNYLLLGGLLSILIPVSNGVMTSDWFWQVWNSFPGVAYVDLVWLLAGITSLFLAIKVININPDYS
jgi:hypothetical protein